MVVTKSLPLDSDHFNFDLTQGFEMAVEKDWNVLDFTDLNDQLTIYDADLRPMHPSNNGVRIFYKACIPMCYVDPENYPDNPLVKTADNASFRGKYLDLINGTVLGSPVNKMSQGSTSEQSFGEFGYHGLLIDSDVPNTKSAYALPDDRALNHTNVAKWAFAGGSSLASCKVDGGYYQPKDISLYTENVMGFAYMLMNKGGYNAGGVASFIVNNGALAYSIDTSANRFNIPTDADHIENNKYLQPALFTPFGVAFADHLTINDQSTPVDTAGWFYCVLGVNELGGEDPSYQIDPQLIRLSDGQGLQIDPVAETYSYSDDISSDSGTLGIEVADYCSIVSINLNGNYLQVPSPVNNVYSVSFSDLTAGDNSLVIVTQDENEQSLTYTFTLDYSATPPGPTPTPGNFNSINLATTSEYSIEYESGVNNYTGVLPPLRSGGNYPVLRILDDNLEGVDVSDTLVIKINGVDVSYTAPAYLPTGSYEFEYTFDGMNFPTISAYFTIGTVNYTVSWYLELPSTTEFDHIDIVSDSSSMSSVTYVSGTTTYSGDLPTMGTGSHVLTVSFIDDEGESFDINSMIPIFNDELVTYDRTAIGTYSIIVPVTGDDKLTLNFDIMSSDYATVSYTVTLETPVTP